MIALFSIRYMLKTVRAGWGSWGNLSGRVHYRPSDKNKTDANAQGRTKWAREGVFLPPHSTAQSGLQRVCRCKMQARMTDGNRHADNFHLILYAV